MLTLNSFGCSCIGSLANPTKPAQKVNEIENAFLSELKRRERRSPGNEVGAEIEAVVVSVCIMYGDMVTSRVLFVDSQF